MSRPIHALRVGGSANDDQPHEVYVTSTGHLNLTSSTPLARPFSIAPVNFSVGNPTLSHSWTMDAVNDTVESGDLLAGTITVQ